MWVSEEREDIWHWRGRVVEEKFLMELSSAQESQHLIPPHPPHTPKVLPHRARIRESTG